MKKQLPLYSKLAILLIFIMFCGNTMAQKLNALNAPSFKLELRNDVQVSPTVYEFDVYLTHIGVATSGDFELSGIQMGIFVNDAIRNGGTFSASIVPGSNSDINSEQKQTQTNMHISKSLPNQTIKITGKTTTAGLGTIISRDGGTRIMRVRLTNSVCFAQAKPNLTWSFSTAFSMPTKVNAYIGNSSKNITANGIFSVSGLTNPTLSSTLSPVVTITPSENPVTNGLPVTLNTSIQSGYTMSTSTWFVNDLPVYNNNMHYTYTPAMDDHVYVSVQFNETCAAPTTSNTIALSALAGMPNSNNSTSISAYSFDHMIYINNPSLVNINEVVVYNTLGQVVTSFKPETTTLKGYNINTTSGSYIVKMVTDKNVVSDKVSIK